MAAYQKINWMVDLKRMARGQKPKAEPWFVAEWAARWAEAGIRASEDADEVGQLERMLRLEDTRC